MNLTTIHSSTLNPVYFAGLLYYSGDNNEGNTVNLSPKYQEEHFKILVLNAVNLAKSLKLQNLGFKLFTNNKEKVTTIASDSILEVEEISFNIEIPKGIKFFSAHHKFDVFRHLSEQINGYYIFCDIDMMCINALPGSLQYHVKHGIPLAYDITDQVIPAYGHERITGDIERLTGKPSEGRWYGGEFIGGTPAFFKTLYDEILTLLPGYFKQIDTFHHIGDEMIVTAALQNQKTRGFTISDAGVVGLVNRYWPIKVLHFQRNFSYNRHIFLLHLPADKVFLSKLATKNFTSSSEFLEAYEQFIHSWIYKLRIFYQEIKRRLRKAK